jgi:molecular chaperone DnaK (HSP70)
MTGKSPNVTVNPDEVVALGAAVQVFFINNPLLDNKLNRV